MIRGLSVTVCDFVSRPCAFALLCMGVCGVRGLHVLKVNAIRGYYERKKKIQKENLVLTVRV